MLYVCVCAYTQILSNLSTYYVPGNILGSEQNKPKSLPSWSLNSRRNCFSPGSSEKGAWGKAEALMLYYRSGRVEKKRSKVNKDA